MKYILLALTCIILTSCKKSKTDSEVGNGFIFGTSASFCGGNCTTLYMIKDGKLYEDDMERFDSKNYRFKTSPMSDEKYQLAKVLEAEFPEYLKQRPGETIGCPDCADQGGYRLSLENNRQRTEWHVDRYDKDHPAEIRGYFKKMNEILEQLR